MERDLNSIEKMCIVRVSKLKGLEGALNNYYFDYLTKKMFIMSPIQNKVREIEIENGIVSLKQKDGDYKRYKIADIERVVENLYKRLSKSVEGIGNKFDKARALRDKLKEVGFGNIDAPLVNPELEGRARIDAVINTIRGLKNE
ncbi:MAG: hypothetical protein ACRC7S_05080 [Cetobacterium sp.]